MPQDLPCLACGVKQSTLKDPKQNPFGAVQIVRVGEPPPPGIDPDHEPGMGIRFIYKDTNQQELVEREVEKLMVSSLGPRLYARLHDMGDKHED